MRTLRTLALLTLLPALVLPAQSKKKKDLSGYDKAARATVLHTANLYVTPDNATPPMATITPGHEVVVLQHNGAWGERVREHRREGRHGREARV